MRGRAGHAGIHQLPPEQGGAVNAIEKMAIVLEAVRRLREHWAQRPSHPYLSAGDCVPTIISGGEWLVSYPASCTLECHIEYLPDRADEHGYGARVEREFGDWIAEATAATTGCASTRRRSSGASAACRPAEVAADEPIVQTLLAAGGDLGQLRPSAASTTGTTAPRSRSRPASPPSASARATSTAPTRPTSTCRSTTSSPARSASR